MQQKLTFITQRGLLTQALSVVLLLICGAGHAARGQLVGGKKSNNPEIVEEKKSDNPETVNPLGMDEQRKRGREMLSRIKTDLQEHYFDSRFRGLDLNSNFKKAEEAIDNAATGDQIYGIIASALLAFEDSHTFFIPPIWSFNVEYGWEMQMIGDKCYVVWVDSGSDAAKQGLKPGDMVLSVFDIPPTRDNLHQLEYLFYRLRPVRAMHVVVQSPGNQIRQLDLLTKTRKATWGTVTEIQERQFYSYQYYYEIGKDLFIWRMPEFDLEEKGMSELMGKVRQCQSLILDLRGNGGGLETTLQRLVGYFFDHDVKIGDRQGRKESKPVMAKTQGDKIFKGKLVVLVDSKSASAAELFARIIQLEKRGTIIGDRTAGAVTEAQRFQHNYQKRGRIDVIYGASITVNEFIMPDGKGLERVGVTPDEVILPAATDLAGQIDPVLSRAAQLVGVTLELKKHPRRDVISQPLQERKN